MVQGTSSLDFLFVGLFFSYVSHSAHASSNTHYVQNGIEPMLIFLLQPLVQSWQLWAIMPGQPDILQNNSVNFLSLPHK